MARTKHTAVPSYGYKPKGTKVSNDRITKVSNDKVTKEPATTKEPTAIKKAAISKAASTPKVKKTASPTVARETRATRAKAAAGAEVDNAHVLLDVVETSNDIEMTSDDDTTALANLARFHEASGLTFEQQYIEDSDPAYDSAGNAAAIQDSTASSDNTPSPKRKTLKLNIRPPVKEPVKLKQTKLDLKTKKRAAEAEPTDDPAEGSSPPRKRAKRAAVDEPTNTAAPTDNLMDSSPSPAKKSKRTVKGKKQAAEDDYSDAAETSDAAEPTEQSDRQPAGTITTKNGKIKKAPTCDLPPGYKGTTDGKGSAIEKPVDPEGDNDKYLAAPWRCGNISCSTGFTWLPRDNIGIDATKGTFGRKVISNYFGRNKKETKRIHPEVWHFFCRRDYQRFLYDATIDQLGPKAVSTLLVTTIRDQLIRLQLWRPEATFKIQLNLGTERRLNAYLALLQKNNNQQAPAMAALPAPRKTGQKKDKLVIEEAFPAYLSIPFKNLHAGENKSYADIQTMLLWCEAQIANGLSDHVPCFELLLSEAQDGETFNDPNNNYSDWLAQKIAAGPPAASAAVASAATSSSASPAASGSASSAAFGSASPTVSGPAPAQHLTPASAPPTQAWPILPMYDPNAKNVLPPRNEFGEYLDRAIEVDKQMELKKELDAEFRATEAEMRANIEAENDHVITVEKLEDFDEALE